MNYKSVIEEQIRELQKVQDNLVKMQNGNEHNIIAVSHEIIKLVECAKTC